MEPITLRLPADLLETLDEEATDRGFSSRSEYIRHLLRNRTATGSTTHDHGPSDTGPVPDRIQARLDGLEDRVAALEAADHDERGAPTADDSSEDDGTGQAPAEPTNGVTGQPAAREPPGVDERIRDQLPKDCPDADVEAVVAIAAFLREVPKGWASPQDIRDAVHAEHPAGKENADYWWSKMAEWLEHVDEVERVHERRVEWVG